MKRLVFLMRASILILVLYVSNLESSGSRELFCFRAFSNFLNRAYCKNQCYNNVYLYLKEAIKSKVDIEGYKVLVIYTKNVKKNYIWKSSAKTMEESKRRWEIKIPLEDTIHGIGSSLENSSGAFFNWSFHVVILDKRNKLILDFDNAAKFHRFKRFFKYYLPVPNTTDKRSILVREYNPKDFVEQMDRIHKVKVRVDDELSKIVREPEVPSVEKKFLDFFRENSTK